MFGIPYAQVPSPVILIFGNIEKFAVLKTPATTGFAAPVNNSCHTLISAFPVEILNS